MTEAKGGRSMPRIPPTRTWPPTSTAPELPAEVVNLYGTYGLMFQQCTKLKKITMLATTVQANAFSNWIASVPSGGTFVMSKDASWSPDPSAANYVAGIVPDGWTVETK